jgi:4-hydroxy-3-methylbut-2-enyl diphosphate reductase
VTIIEENTKLGYSTIIVGDEGHAEVTGLLGYTNGNGYVISSLEEVSDLPDMEKICIVAQTTQDMNTFALIAERLKQRYGNHKVFDTICSSTSRRQEEVISLSEDVDAMIVVGGRGSANTNRLVQISEKKGTPTFLVETEKELDLKKLADYGVIGVTAGASTPNWLLQRVVDNVQNYQGKKNKKIQSFTEKAITILIGSFMYIGIGAASFSYSSSVLLGINPRIKFCAIATLFLFSMYVLNYFANKEDAALSEPSRACVQGFYSSKEVFQRCQVSKLGSNTGFKRDVYKYRLGGKYRFNSIFGITRILFVIASCCISIYFQHGFHKNSIA